MEIAELKLRQYLIEIQKEEKYNTEQMLELLDRQKKYFRLLKGEKE